MRSIPALAVLSAAAFALSVNGGQKSMEYSDDDADFGTPLKYPTTWTVPTQDDDGTLQDPINPFTETLSAIDVLQSQFFEVWLGIWPESIDWTGCVVGTQVAGALRSITRGLNITLADMQPPDKASEVYLENVVNRYFSELISYYFGEDFFAIRLQAHDDMLWVVLGWLEAIKFMNTHDKLHYFYEKQWYGKQFEAAFAHRARIFYDIVAAAWDTCLCDGGLTWNPNLRPYKNTITNTLYISASVGMYLYHPGDENRAPFTATNQQPRLDVPVAIPHDPKYLRAAVDAYDWFVKTNFTNAHGLFVDGYHITDYGRNGSIGTGKCDVRNEMVYTYNQGVLLSGLRGLWESTGDIFYLEDGHRLVRNVLNATGWFDVTEPQPKSAASSEGHPWRGLGRRGILQEFCDPSGSCSQDGQTFKGILFHHLTLFCEPLPVDEALVPGTTWTASRGLAFLHANSCREYLPWVAHNAKAALATKDENGIFGAWWDAASEKAISPELPRGAIDIRDSRRAESSRRSRAGTVLFNQEQDRLGSDNNSASEDNKGDVNDRGRGRTVETQAGGLAVVRAHWELTRLYGC